MELYFEHTVFYHPELIPGTFCVRAAAAAGRLLMNFLRQKQSELLPVLGCFMPVFESVCVGDSHLALAAAHSSSSELCCRYEAALLLALLLLLRLLLLLLLLLLLSVDNFQKL